MENVTGVEGRAGEGGGGLGKVKRGGSLIHFLQTVRSQPQEFPKVETGRRRLKGESFQRQGRPSEICSVNTSNNLTLARCWGSDTVKVLALRMLQAGVSGEEKYELLCLVGKPSSVVPAEEPKRVHFEVQVWGAGVGRG